METIINVEDRLRTIKDIFLLGNRAKVFPKEIVIHTVYQKWEPVINFRSECLKLSFENPAATKTVEIIYGLCCEIIDSFKELRTYLDKQGSDPVYIYTVACKPHIHHGGNSIYTDLIREEIISGKQEAFANFDNGVWYDFRPRFTEEDIEFIVTNPLFLIIFVEGIRLFLEERILIKAPGGTNTAINTNKNLNYTVKSIILACYYAYYGGKFNFIPEIGENPLVLKKVHQKLAESYGLAYASFRNDWHYIFDNPENRTTKAMIPNIICAIDILKGHSDSQRNDAINLATQELSIAELNK